ncbi:hypothetical protein [Chelativorans sp.]|uniref:hypothetical protein n=1 Tax=Chelativorans sp. TaxID=2203393 RepID=UPI002810EA3E|nr:hypothetical protein [Chelativorans sp.]
MTRFKSFACLLGLVSGIAGCSGTDALDLSPSASIDTATPSGENTASTTLTEQTTVGAQGSAATAAATQDARLQFAPVIGAAAEATQPLSSRLSARAGQRGLTLAGGSDGATHIIKGYFSTMTDEKGTTVVYVWDVLDPAGNRLHRIQGQEKAAAGAEGWSAVTGATMETIADRTIEELAAWLQGSQSRG